MWRTVMTFIVAAAATMIGLGIAYYKHSTLSFPLAPDTSINSWYVELHTSLQSPERWRRKAGIPQQSALHMIAPIGTRNFAVVDSQVIARGFGKQGSNESGKPMLSFTKRNPDNSESVYLRFMLYELDIDETAEINSVADTSIATNAYLKKNRLSNPDEDIASLYESIDMIVDDALGTSSSPRSFVSELWKALDKDAGMLKYLQQGTGIKDKVAVMVMLSQVAGYDARVANGLSLSDESERSARIRQWLEVRHNDTWAMFDVDTGDFISKNARLYRWWTGTDPLITTEYFRNFVTSISVKPNIDSSLTRALWNAKEKQPIAYRYSALTLPLDQQVVLQVLLMMPLGGLIVAFMRQVIGVKTFGTFMPVLVALALRETGAEFGIAFFMTIVFIGLLVRSYLDKLRLLLVPRLAAVLSVVVGLIIFAMITFKDSDIPLGVSVALFPVVIMTMFIERMSTMWDESGAKSAITACIGSLIIAWVIYLIAINPWVKHAMITFPELLFVVFGLCLILGRYNGYKLTEYRRFRQLKRAIIAQEKLQQQSKV
jgi:7 transmembrane helices usually fused to an inactive transglutaminase/Inactive transglutaminase fused to 7 transmembrane helices